MTRIEFWEPSGETDVPGKGTFRDRYARDAFASSIGKRVPFRSFPGGPQIGWMTVVSVTVDEDGFGATWVVDADLDGREMVRRAPRASFSFRPDQPAPQPHDPLAAKPPVIRHEP
jgi:hypothetical protein